jgi:dTDP-4-amino-4,6-dideoxygalactose transaminase
LYLQISMNKSYFYNRPDIENLQEYGLKFEQTWQVTDHFERIVAEYFGAPYAVATDCCTHALELCFKAINYRDTVTVPKHTYMSVPMMLDKINVPYHLVDISWEKCYDLVPGLIVDAATMWEANSYQAGYLMCISFQFKKHIPIGRGGIILLDDYNQYKRLKRMSHDGRDPTKNQFDDNITELGYHYYMTPEDAARGIHLFNNLKHETPTIWSWQDYRDLTEMNFFKGRTGAE